MSKKTKLLNSVFLFNYYVDLILFKHNIILNSCNLLIDAIGDDSRLHKMLVYEFMPKKSLDSFLFNKS